MRKTMKQILADSRAKANEIANRKNFEQGYKEVVKETDKAYLIAFLHVKDEEFNDVWVPKSVVEKLDDNFITVKSWFAAKNLVWTI